MLDRFFRWFLMGQFTAVFCIGGGIWFPKVRPNL